MHALGTAYERHQATFAAKTTALISSAQRRQGVAIRLVLWHICGRQTCQDTAHQLPTMSENELARYGSSNSHSVATGLARQRSTEAPTYAPSDKTQLSASLHACACLQAVLRNIIDTSRFRPSTGQSMYRKPLLCGGRLGSSLSRPWDELRTRSAPF